MGQYDRLFFKLEKEETHNPLMTPFQQYFRGDRSIKGAQIYLPYRAFVKPGVIDAEPHFHRDEEYLAFVGYDVRDAFESFDAEIELWLGEDIHNMQKIVITKPTMIRVPQFYWHGPIEIKRLGKPLFFQPVLMGSRYCAIRYREDENGHPYYDTLVEGITPCKQDPDKVWDPAQGSYDAPKQVWQGTPGTVRYDNLIHTFEKQYTKWGDFMPPYQAYFRGHDCMKDSSLYTCYRPYMKDAFIDRTPNFHAEEEYLCFTGYDMTDPWGSFDATIEFWIGEDLKNLEQHIFTEPTLIRIPPYTWHTPLQFHNVKKPVYLQVLGTRGKFGTGQIKFMPDGSHIIEYTGSAGHKPCTFDPNKQCTFCGRCVMQRFGKGEGPQNATEAAHYWMELARNGFKPPKD